MTLNIEAIYESGVLRPLTPISLPENQVVSLEISINSEQAASPREHVRDHSGFLNSYTPKDEGLYDDDVLRLTLEFEKWKSALRARLKQFREDWHQPKVRGGVAACESLIESYFSEMPPKNTEDFKRLYNLYSEHLKTVDVIENGFERRRVLY